MIRRAIDALSDVFMITFSLAFIVITVALTVVSLQFFILLAWLLLSATFEIGG